MKTLHALKYTPADTFHIGYEEADREASEESEDGLYVSEEEFWEKYYNHPDFNYEWKNGYLEEKPMADSESSFVYDWFSEILKCYLSAYPVGKTVTFEIGFRLELPGDVSIRKPDRAVVLHDNPVKLHRKDCNFDGIFDLCIESLSYSEKKEIIRDTVEKKEEYEGVGVREYYILDARGKETAFYRLNRKGKYQKIKQENGDIIKSEVLPGFQFRISDLYNQPSLEKLTEDEVYQGYVLPFHQEVKKKAEQERQRAEKAEQRAEKERQRAEKERQRVKKEKQRVKEEKQRAEAERQRAESFALKLRELGVEV